MAGWKVKSLSILFFNSMTKKIPWAFILFLVFVFFNEYIGCNVLKNDFPIDDAFRIMCFGDSYTYGKGSWPVLLEEILNQRQNGKKIKVYNFSYPDYNSTMIVRKLKKTIVAVKPAVVIIMTGRLDNWNTNTREPLSEEFQAWSKTRRALIREKTQQWITLIRRFMGKSPEEDKKEGIFLRDYYSEDLFREQTRQLINEGNVYRANQNFKRAVDCYQQALILEPYNNTVFLELGRCYKLAHIYAEAINALTSALKIDQYNQKIYEELDDIFISINNPKEAVDCYTNLFAVYLNNEWVKKRLINALILFGDTLFLEGRFDEAIIYYERVLDINPHYEPLFSNIGYNVSIKKNAEGKQRFPFSDLFLMKGKEKRKQEERTEILFHNLVKIAKLCQKEGVTVIFSSYPRQLIEVVEEVAQLYNVCFIDHRFAFEQLLKDLPEDKFFGSDGHCYQEGHKIVAENIANEILQILNRQKKNEF